MNTDTALLPFLTYTKELIVAKKKTFTPVTSLPTDWRNKRLERLKWEIASGIKTENLSAEQNDLLHMGTSEENVLYWKAENERAESDERCLHCQSIARSIIVALRAKDPPIKD